MMTNLSRLTQDRIFRYTIVHLFNGDVEMFCEETDSLVKEVNDRLNKVETRIEAIHQPGHIEENERLIQVYTGSRDGCQHWYEPLNTCNLKREQVFDRIKTCSNCPLWTHTDAIYEDITKHRIMQTYDWWRNEFITSDIREAAPYALDRMKDHVKTYVTPPPEPDPQIVKDHRYRRGHVTDLPSVPDYRLTFGECVAAMCAAVIIAFFMYCAMH
jgi:hypothetical protein